MSLSSFPAAITLADIGLVGVLGLLIPFVSWLEGRVDPPADPASVEGNRYRRRSSLINITMLWGMTAAVLFVWFWNARGLGTLGLSLPDQWSWHAGIGWTVSALLTALYVFSLGRADADSHRIIIEMLDNEPGIAALTPAQAQHYPLWAALSVSAGITEEILYRGYVIAILTPIIGLAAAASVSLVLFIAAHAYQKSQGLVRVTATGAVLTGLAVASDSLWPVILLHTVIDLGSGWSILRARRALASA